MSDVLLVEPARITLLNTLICALLTTFIYTAHEAAGEGGGGLGTGRKEGKIDRARGSRKFAVVELFKRYNGIFHTLA